MKLSTDLASQPEDEIVYLESEQSFLSTQVKKIIIYMYFTEIVQSSKTSPVNNGIQGRTLRKERNHFEQTRSLTFPLSIRVHVTPTSKREVK